MMLKDKYYKEVRKNSNDFEEAGWLQSVLDKQKLSYFITTREERQF